MILVSELGGPKYSTKSNSLIGSCSKIDKEVVADAVSSVISFSLVRTTSIFETNAREALLD